MFYTCISRVFVCRVPRLSEACAPLREISNSTSEFSWADTQQAAFTDIKQKVTSACALQYFDPGAPVTLQVDASDYDIGATLLQKNHPVAYSSTTLTKSEKDNYAQIEKECLAIVSGSVSGSSGYTVIITLS